MRGNFLGLWEGETILLNQSRQLFEAKNGANWVKLSLFSKKSRGGQAKVEHV